MKEYLYRQLTPHSILFNSEITTFFLPLCFRFLWQSSVLPLNRKANSRHVSYLCYCKHFYQYFTCTLSIHFIVYSGVQISVSGGGGVTGNEKIKLNRVIKIIKKKGKIPHPLPLQTIFSNPFVCIVDKYFTYNLCYFNTLKIYWKICFSL